MKNHFIFGALSIILIALVSCAPVKQDSTSDNTDSQAMTHVGFTVEDGKLYEELKIDSSGVIKEKFISSDVVVATPDTIGEVINSVNSGYVFLSPGTYSSFEIGQSKKVSSATINGESADISTFDENTTGTIAYKREIEDLTVVGSEDAVIDGTISLVSSHAYGTSSSPCTDPVRNITSTTVSYNEMLEIDGLTFDGLKFENGGKVRFAFYLGQNMGFAKNLTFKDLSFSGTKSSDSNNAAFSIATDSPGVFSNLVFDNVSIDGYFQGVFVQNPENFTITNSSINNTAHNAIAIQSSGNGTFAGNIVISENSISNADDRAIRFGVGSDATIKITDNIFINAADSDGELLKTQAITNVTYAFDNNTVNGVLKENIEGDSSPWIVTIAE